MGRQGRVVDRDRHATIADVGQQFDRVEKIVVRKTVSVVTEVHFRFSVGRAERSELPPNLGWWDSPRSAHPTIVPSG